MKADHHECKRIMIVDDDPDILLYLEGEARKIGLKFQFEKAGSFTQAVDSMVSGRFDLVIIDFPGIRGPYLLNLAFLREIPVVLLVSLNFFPLEAQHLLEKGIKGVLPKENLSEIIPVLENIFSSKKAPIPPEGLKEMISCMMR